MEIHIKDVTMLQRALDMTNWMFSGNITWKRNPKYIRQDREGREVLTCTIKVKNSHGPGARISSTGRAIPAACWHVHGEFFDNIWALDPGARIKTRTADMKGPSDNWQGGETNIGSKMNPLWMKEACNCE